ncbi:MAG: UDP-N-acetylglucosamine 2-epimerase (non-hydrolyzing) [Candidatus Accumulibacter phosphatis]|uniref:non-hydrolyzing UDP-N-acetylglucosamine 2-epimerase n=1 Tax=Candidatus Accumulibacter sp. ACC012 TaxID=2823332 RepID=UPI0025B8F5EE|nr:UDP-N-acetylglucosamine 2-epimerase (non-hydrolyzing) [Candidatus Accumulibacter sp. ACC012]
MKRIVTIVGARPQFIKAAMVSRALKSSGQFSEIVLHTGQHYDKNMSDIFFDELGIPKPDYNLGVGGGGHGQNTGRMLEGIESILNKERPDWVLVYGDTDSTLAGALAAVKLLIPLAHVEAGLRSYNKQMPEEINRRLTDHASDLLFAPTLSAIATLAKEGIVGPQVVNVGDVMFDAARTFGEVAAKRSKILQELGLRSKSYILATVHRQENTDSRERLGNILVGFSAASLPVLLPLHPRTKQRIASLALDIPPNVRVIDPVGYLDMTLLERNAALVATDSGGVQKEAYFHGVPCLTLRDETEWTELIELGWNTLVSPGRADLASFFRANYREGAGDATPYGNGKAAEAIARELVVY